MTVEARLNDTAREIAARCQPCQFAVPLLQEVWTEYQGQPIPPPVQFVVVSVNENPSPTVLQQLGITIPWLTDPSIAGLYEVAAGVPKYFFLDHNLKIAKIQFGLFSSDPEGQKTASARRSASACGCCRYSASPTGRRSLCSSSGESSGAAVER